MSQLRSYKMAMETILSDLSVSMTEFKKNPNETLRESGGRAVAVLSHNKPAFYMVPPDRYEAMLEEINDLRLVRVAKERLKQKDRAIEVTLDDL
jgi:antitoxin StbD